VLLTDWAPSVQRSFLPVSVFWASLPKNFPPFLNFSGADIVYSVNTPRFLFYGRALHVSFL